MKTLFTCVAAIIGFVMCSEAITLNVNTAKNIASLQHNTGIATMVNSTSRDMRAYEITVYRTKSDKDEYKLFAMTSVFISEASGGMKSKKMTCWVPQSFKTTTLSTNDIGKTTYVYATPIAKFEKEKWRYIGNYSKGAKINGIMVGLISVEKNKIIKIINRSMGAKVPKNTQELDDIVKNERVADVMKESGYFEVLEAGLENLK